MKRRSFLAACLATVFCPWPKDLFDTLKYPQIDPDCWDAIRGLEEEGAHVVGFDPLLYGNGRRA